MEVAIKRQQTVLSYLVLLLQLFAFDLARKIEGERVREEEGESEREEEGKRKNKREREKVRAGKIVGKHWRI